jgi:hypothetical protein
MSKTPSTRSSTDESPRIGGVRLPPGMLPLCSAQLLHLGIDLTFELAPPLCESFQGTSSTVVEAMPVEPPIGSTSTSR